MAAPPPPPSAEDVFLSALEETVPALVLAFKKPAPAPASSASTKPPSPTAAPSALAPAKNLCTTTPTKATATSSDPAQANTNLPTIPTKPKAPPTFPLFSLPPELRLLIYHQALYTPEPIRNSGTYRPREPSLLHSTRLLRSEALLTFYATNTFVFSTYGTATQPVTQYLQALGPRRAHMIRHLVLRHRLESFRETLHRRGDGSVILLKDFMSQQVRDLVRRHVVELVRETGLRVSAIEFEGPEGMERRADGFMERYAREGRVVVEEIVEGRLGVERRVVVLDEEDEDEDGVEAEEEEDDEETVCGEGEDGEEMDWEESGGVKVDYGDGDLDRVFE